MPRSLEKRSKGKSAKYNDNDDGGDDDDYLLKSWLDGVALLSRRQSGLPYVCGAKRLEVILYS